MIYIEMSGVKWGIELNHNMYTLDELHTQIVGAHTKSGGFIKLKRSDGVSCLINVRHIIRITDFDNRDR